MRSHNKERPFACTEPDCDKTFPRKDHLQRHIKNAHSDPAVERTFTCDWKGCGKSFTSNGRLQRHKDVHDSKYYCTEFPPCSEAFRKEKALDAHIKTQHMEVKPYPCTFVDAETGDRCTNGYQTDSALQKHMHKVHATSQEPAIFCMICAESKETNELQGGDMDDVYVEPLSFATHEELTAHVAECHPPECKECGQRFSNDANLKAHFEAVHVEPSRQSRYACPRPGCDSTFNRKHNLTVHIQTVHDNQARYFCTSGAFENSNHDDLKAWDGKNACGAAFKAKSSRDQHVRTTHLGQGNRKHCDVRFYIDRDLRRHMRATHNVPDDDLEEMIRDRDALTGGQFWIGGVDDQTSMFDSVDHSMPHTPVPYFNDGSAPQLLYGANGQMKPMGPPMNFFGQQFGELSLMNEDAEMDMAMGLGDLAPAADVQEGLQWDLLAPVEQFNTNEQR
jgi:general transcription factor IIIA